MDHTSVATLLLITFLQSCHQQEVPSWFSANVIRDGDFSPKPISEIFSTDSPFSTSNPIVVLQNSTSETFRPFSSTTEKQEASTMSPSMSTGTPNVAVMPLPQPTTPQPEPSSAPPVQSSSSISPTSTVTTQRPSSRSSSTTTMTTTQQPIFFNNIQPQLPLDLTPNFGVSWSPFLPNQPNFPKIIQPMASTATSTPRPVSSVPQGFQPPQVTQTNPQTPSTPPQPNYFVIYSPGPQSIVGGSSVATSQRTVFTPSNTPITESPTTQRPCNTATTGTPQQVNMSSVQPTAANPPRATSTQNILMQPGLPQGNSIIGTIPNGQIVQAGISPNVKSFRIRLVSPTGSLTKLKFVNPTTTTKRPPTSRRPTTTRKPAPAKKDKKLNRNTYDDCMKGCPNSKRPVCATPLGERPINADRLRGFPSICHMACHNSYNRNHYERVIEGRCGKLRTQIRLYGSDKKVKKDDLNKTQYSIDQGNTAFVELTSFKAKK